MAAVTNTITAANTVSGLDLTSAQGSISVPSEIYGKLADTLNAQIAEFIRKKLKAMDLEVGGLELHSSSQTKTWRAYITLKRAINLKAASMADQILTAEIERQFGFRPYAFYWRYQAEETAKDTATD